MSEKTIPMTFGKEDQDLFTKLNTFEDKLDETLAACNHLFQQTRQLFDKSKELYQKTKEEAKICRLMMQKLKTLETRVIALEQNRPLNE